MSIFERAYLALVKPPQSLLSPMGFAQIASMAVSGGVGEFVFSFNPKEISISKSANWESRSQAGAAQTAMPQFMGSQPAQLTLEVFLDDSDAKVPTVAMRVGKLLDTVTPLQQSLFADVPSPPWVVFGWGRHVHFVGVVKSVSAKYTMFNSDGTPTRAQCSLSVEEVPTDPSPRQNPTSGSDTATRMHHVVAGDTLHSIAQAEYGKASMWRGLASHNGVDDPMRLKPGSSLFVPAADELENVV